MECEHKTTIVGGYICGICKCPLKAKTKVADEVCPANNWHDIKEFPEQGIAVRIHDAEKVFMTVEGEKIVIEYVDDLILTQTQILLNLSLASLTCEEIMMDLKIMK